MPPHDGVESAGTKMMESLSNFHLEMELEEEQEKRTSWSGSHPYGSKGSGSSRSGSGKSSKGRQSKTGKGSSKSAAEQPQQQQPHEDSFSSADTADKIKKKEREKDRRRSVSILEGLESFRIPGANGSVTSFSLEGLEVSQHSLSPTEQLVPTEAKLKEEKEKQTKKEAPTPAKKASTSNSKKQQGQKQQKQRQDQQLQQSPPPSLRTSPLLWHSPTRARAQSATPPPPSAPPLHSKSESYASTRRNTKTVRFQFDDDRVIRAGQASVDLSEDEEDGDSTYEREDEEEGSLPRSYEDGDDYHSEDDYDHDNYEDSPRPKAKAKVKAKSSKGKPKKSSSTSSSKQIPRNSSRSSNSHGSGKSRTSDSSSNKQRKKRESTTATTSKTNTKSTKTTKSMTRRAEDNDNNNSPKPLKISTRGSGGGNHEREGQSEHSGSHKSASTGSSTVQTGTNSNRSPKKGRAATTSSRKSANAANHHPSDFMMDNNSHSTNGTGISSRSNKSNRSGPTANSKRRASLMPPPTTSITTTTTPAKTTRARRASASNIAQRYSAIQEAELLFQSFGSINKEIFQKPHQPKSQSQHTDDAEADTRRRSRRRSYSAGGGGGYEDSNAPPELMPMPSNDTQDIISTLTPTPSSTGKQSAYDKDDENDCYELQPNHDETTPLTTNKYYSDRVDPFALQKKHPLHQQPFVDKVTSHSRSTATTMMSSSHLQQDQRQSSPIITAIIAEEEQPKRMLPQYHRSSSVDPEEQQLYKERQREQEIRELRRIQSSKDVLSTEDIDLIETFVYQKQHQQQQQQQESDHTPGDFVGNANANSSAAPLPKTSSTSSSRATPRDPSLIVAEEDMLHEKVEDPINDSTTTATNDDRDLAKDVSYEEYMTDTEDVPSFALELDEEEDDNDGHHGNGDNDNDHDDENSFSLWDDVDIDLGRITPDSQRGGPGSSSALNFSDDDLDSDDFISDSDEEEDNSKQSSQQMRDQIAAVRATLQQGRDQAKATQDTLQKELDTSRRLREKLANRSNHNPNNRSSPTIDTKIKRNEGILVMEPETDPLLAVEAKRQQSGDTMLIDGVLVGKREEDDEHDMEEDNSIPTSIRLNGSEHQLSLGSLSNSMSTFGSFASGKSNGGKRSDNRLQMHKSLHQALHQSISDFGKSSRTLRRELNNSNDQQHQQLGTSLQENHFLLGSSARRRNDIPVGLTSSRKTSYNKFTNTPKGGWINDSNRKSLVHKAMTEKGAASLARAGSIAESGPPALLDASSSSLARALQKDRQIMSPTKGNRRTNHFERMVIHDTLDQLEMEATQQSKHPLKQPQQQRQGIQHNNTPVGKKVMKDSSLQSALAASQRRSGEQPDIPLREQEVMGSSLQSRGTTTTSERRTAKHDDTVDQEPEAMGSSLQSSLRRGQEENNSPEEEPGEMGSSLQSSSGTTSLRGSKQDRQPATRKSSHGSRGSKGDKTMDDSSKRHGGTMGGSSRRLMDSSSRRNLNSSSRRNLDASKSRRNMDASKSRRTSHRPESQRQRSSVALNDKSEKEKSRRTSRRGDRSSTIKDQSEKEKSRRTSRGGERSSMRDQSEKDKSRRTSRAAERTSMRDTSEKEKSRRTSRAGDRSSMRDQSEKDHTRRTSRAAGERTSMRDKSDKEHTRRTSRAAGERSTMKDKSERDRTKRTSQRTDKKDDKTTTRRRTADMDMAADRSSRKSMRASSRKSSRQSSSRQILDERASRNMGDETRDTSAGPKGLGEQGDKTNTPEQLNRDNKDQQSKSGIVTPSLDTETTMGTTTTGRPYSPASTPDRRKLLRKNSSLSELDDLAQEARKSGGQNSTSKLSKSDSNLPFDADEEYEEQRRSRSKDRSEGRSRSKDRSERKSRRSRSRKDEEGKSTRRRETYKEKPQRNRSKSRSKRHGSSTRKSDRERSESRQRTVASDDKSKGQEDVLIPVQAFIYHEGGKALVVVDDVGTDGKAVGSGYKKDVMESSSTGSLDAKDLDRSRDQTLDHTHKSIGSLNASDDNNKQKRRSLKTRDIVFGENQQEVDNSSTQPGGALDDRPLFLRTNSDISALSFPPSDRQTRREKERQRLEQLNITPSTLKEPAPVPMIIAIVSDRQQNELESKEDDERSIANSTTPSSLSWGTPTGTKGRWQYNDAVEGSFQGSGQVEELYGSFGNLDGGLQNKKQNPDDDLNMSFGAFETSYATPRFGGIKKSMSLLAANAQPDLYTDTDGVAHNNSDSDASVDNGSDNADDNDGELPRWKRRQSTHSIMVDISERSAGKSQSQRLDKNAVGETIQKDSRKLLRQISVEQCHQEPDEKFWNVASKAFQ